MTPMTKEALSQLRLKAEKATKGEWWSDSIGNEGTHGAGDDCVEGFTSYAVYDENDRVLLDTLNSSAACIQEEYDGEGHVAWDEVGQRNAEFIAAANPVTVLALLDALESEKTLNQHLDLALRKEEGVNAALRRNIAELQSRAESAEQVSADYRARLDRLENRCDHKFSVYWDASDVKRCSRCGLGITLQIQGGE